ncbi:MULTISPECIES: tyrosine-type recombinase/integrase [Vibrio]|uniref:tyrosine-type recombinase/integrase n=1 Tax=Vibrio TaxID=662 RepID=UPI00031AB5FF|nr:tyrosine-type recombinase/integrase [Vibrio harveyi]
MSTKSIKIHSGLSIRKLPQSKNYSVYIKFDSHKKRQFSLKTPDLDEAIAKAKAQYQFHELMLENGVPFPQTQERVSLHKIINKLIQEHEKAQDKVKIDGRDGKFATQIRIFNKIKGFYNSKTKPNDLNIAEIRKYFEKNQPFSTTQLVATRYCFTAIQDRSLEKKQINADQVVDLTKIKVEKLTQSRRDHFSYYEFTKVANHGLKEINKSHGKGKHTQHMAVHYISFLYHSGVRAGFEALGIKWSDLGFTAFGDLYATIKDGKTKDYKKNNRNVLFNLLAEDCLISVAKVKHPEIAKNNTKKAVIEYLIRNKPNETIFSTIYSKTPTYPKIFKKWIDHLKSLGKLPRDKDLTLYSLRHSYITTSIEEGVPLPLIAENAGTSASMIEKHYSHITVMTQQARTALVRDKVAIEKELPKETPEQFEDRKKSLILSMISKVDQIE